MAEKNKQYRATFFCVDDVTQEFITGEDNTTLTMKLFQDHGSATDPTNDPAELDAVNAPGVYTLLITAGEMAYDTVMLYGLSSTADVRVIPVVIQTNQVEAVKADVGQVDTNVDNARTEIGQLNDFDPATQIVKSNIEQVQGIAVTNVDDFKSDVSGLSTFDNTNDVVISNVASIAGNPVTSADDFKADVSGLALEASVQAIPTDTSSSLDVTQAQASIENKIDAEGLKITEIQAGVAGSAVRSAGVTTYFDPSTSTATHKMSDPTENGRTRSEV